MPQFELSHYKALRDLIRSAEREGWDSAPANKRELDRARDALAALRRFFPSLEAWEREQAAKERV